MSRERERYLGQCIAALRSQRSGGPRSVSWGPSLCLPRGSSVGNEPWIRINQTGFGPAVQLAHHFPSLNLSSTHGVVARIQEENLGECLETAEERGGLALRTVCPLWGWPAFHPWNCQTLVHEGLAQGMGRHQLGEGRGQESWCPKEEGWGVGPQGGPLPGGQAEFNGMGRGGEEGWGQGAEEAGAAWAVELLP